MKNPHLKLTSLLLVTLLTLLCCACGGNADSPTNQDNAASGNDSNSSANSSVTVTDQTRPYYKPVSLTLTIFDTATNSYGFTWNTTNQPVEPVIQICEGSTFNESACIEVKATVKTETTMTSSSKSVYYYISKANVALKSSTEYTYRAYDKGAQIGSDATTFKTADFTAKSFRFVHISDSQVSGPDSNDKSVTTGTGVYLGNVYEALTQNGNPDFALHTGDIVQYAKYQSSWVNMIDANSKYFTTIPTMAISGNHEAESHYAGTNEIYNRFNYNIPEQDTSTGIYYSFIYGDVKFIMLNTGARTGDALDATQYDWLVKELENKTTKWVIVSLHIPMYSVGEYGANPDKNADSLALRAQLTRLFGDYKVDLVLQAHDHVVSKTYPIKSDGTAIIGTKTETYNSVEYAVNPKGVIYSMHGTAGNQERAPKSNADKSLYEFTKASNYSTWAEITVENDRLTVIVKYNSEVTGVNVCYSYGIIKK